MTQICLTSLCKTEVALLEYEQLLVIGIMACKVIDIHFTQTFSFGLRQGGLRVPPSPYHPQVLSLLLKRAAVSGGRRCYCYEYF